MGDEMVDQPIPSKVGHIVVIIRVYCESGASEFHKGSVRTG